MSDDQIHRQEASIPGLDRGDGPRKDQDEAAGAPAPGDVQEILRVLDEIWPGEGQVRGILQDLEGAGADRDPDRGRPGAKVGHRQIEKFRILRELGRGGFGIVFLAEDTVLGRKVALKVPRGDFLSHPEVWARFQQEARAASRVDHPNLVPLHEVSGSGVVGYIVSAYVPGPSLDQWIKHHGAASAPPRWAARIAAALARAVEHIHRQGVLHRDLKPANVLLHAPGVEADPAEPSSWADVPIESWVPRICDFGLAKLRDMDGVETRTRVVAGSPSYMAPEQAEARRGEVGPATDVYGVGALLYKMLTGRAPFSGETDLDTLRHVVEDDPVPPRGRRPEVPRDLETICLKCLEKRPERRYATAAELAGDLERFLDGRPITARPASAWERLRRWVGRTPERRVLAVACVFAVLVLAFAMIPGSLTGTRAGLTAWPGGSESRLREYRRRQQSAHRVLVAQEAAMAWNPDVAGNLLDEAGPGLGPPGGRGFAWSYVDRLLRDRLLEGHTREVVCVAADPTGQTIASGDEGGEIRIWDRGSGRCQVIPSGSDRPVWRLVFSSDGKRLASANREVGHVRLWDVASARPLAVPALKELVQVLRLFFADRDRRLVAMLSRNHRDPPEIVAWDLTRPGDHLPVVPASDPTIAALGRVDPRLAAIADVLDGSATARADIDQPSRSWAAAAPLGVASTRDRQLIVVGRGDGTFAVHRAGTSLRLALGRIAPTGNLLVLFDPAEYPTPLAPLPGERFENLANALIPQPPARRRESDLLYRVSMNDPVALTPDRNELALSDSKQQRLSVIDLASGRETGLIELVRFKEPRSLCFIDGGKVLLMGSVDHLVRIWDRHPNESSFVLEAHTPAEAWAVAFAPDGTTLASAGDDHEVRLWDLRDLPAPRPVTLPQGHESLVTSLAFAPDGRTLASGSFDESVILWDVNGKRPVDRLGGKLSKVRSVAFNPEGSFLASGGDNHEVNVWDIRSRSQVMRMLGHSDGVHALAFSPDGKTLVSGGLDARILLTSLASGERRELHPANQVFALAFTLDGSRLVSAHDHGAILIWDLTTGAEAATIPGNGADVLCVAISPDGRTLAAGGEDRIVRVWDLATLEQELALGGCRGRVNSLAFSPDGRILAAADHSGAVMLWDARPRR